MLENIHNVYGSQPVSLNQCKEFLKNIQPKDKRYNLFDSTKMILNEYKGITKCLAQYEASKVLLPLMVHENYSASLENRSCTVNEYYDACANISDYISSGDVTSTNMYTDQNWHLQKSFGFYTCCMPTFELSKYKLKNPNYKIVFSGDLNNPSIKNINKVNILKVDMELSKKLDDILVIKKLLSSLLARQKLQRVKDMFRKYELKQADLSKMINMLLKIDKTSEITSITTKIGKILMQL